MFLKKSIERNKQDKLVIHKENCIRTIDEMFEQCKDEEETEWLLIYLESVLNDSAKNRLEDIKIKSLL